jgi:hypothetical protein
MQAVTSSPHVSISLSAGITPPDMTRTQDLQIGHIFLGIMTGAASVMSLIGFALSGHPLLLISGIMFGIATISILPDDSAHTRHRTVTTYTNPPYSSYSSSPLPVVIDSYSAHASQLYVAPLPTQAVRPARRQPVAYHPPMPSDISPATYQQRAPVGQRITDVYTTPNNFPTTQTYVPSISTHSPFYQSSHSSPSSMAPSAPFVEPFQETGTTGSGATARAKVGR